MIWQPVTLGFVDKVLESGIICFQVSWLLAQGKGADGAATAANDTPPPSGIFDILFGNPLFLAILVGLLFYLMVFSPQQSSARQQQKTLAEALKNLKKNDRVLTAGGIYGVVVNIIPETGVVSIRVDETNNTRLSITRESIVRVIAEEPSTDKNKS